MLGNLGKLILLQKKIQDHDVVYKCLPKQMSEIQSLVRMLESRAAEAL